MLFLVRLGSAICFVSKFPSPTQKINCIGEHCFVIPNMYVTVATNASIFYKKVVELVLIKILETFICL